jgi:hypothetical protein
MSNGKPAPLTVGVDRETGELLVVAKFAVRYDVNGKLVSTFATCAGRALQARFLAGLKHANDVQTSVERRYLSTKAAAAYVGMTPNALRAAARRWQVKPTKKGGTERLVWSVAELNRYLTGGDGHGTGSTGMSGSSGGTGSSGMSVSSSPDAGADAGVAVPRSCAPGGPGR